MQCSLCKEMSKSYELGSVTEEYLRKVVTQMYNSCTKKIVNAGDIENLLNATVRKTVPEQLRMVVI